MAKIKRFFFVFSIFLVMDYSWSLEVDDKLTGRLLKISESKKTVLVNRGLEDGLAEGNHAKFIVSTGIIARGVVVKLSPTRSVWSLYRLVNADYIVPDTVTTLKITPEVKITKDESKSLVQEDVPIEGKSVESLGIPLAEGAGDLETQEMAPLSEQLAREYVILTEKNYEVFGLLHLQALNGETVNEKGTESFSSSQSFQHLTLGGEIYSKNEREWFSPFSLYLALNLMKIDNQAHNGSSSQNNVTEISGGLNWHFSSLPSLTEKFIPFLHASVNFGIAKSQYTSGAEGGVDSISASATTSGFSIGLGFKYYMSRGLGFRILADYYSRNESYEEDDLSYQFSKSVAGPRLLLGLGYRF